MSWIPDTGDVTTSLVFVAVFLLVLSMMTREKTGIPGPLSLPIIGNSLQILVTPIEDTNQLLERLSRKYGGIFRLEIGSYLFVCISGYDNLYDMFVKNGHLFNDRPTHLPGFRGTNAPKGILWSSGDYWKKVRRFTLQSMRDFGMGKRSLEGIVLEETKNIDAAFEKLQGQPIYNTKATMTLGVSNIIHSIIFGYRSQVKVDVEKLKNPPILIVGDERCQHDDEKFRSLIQSLDGIAKIFNFISVNVTMPIWLRMFLSPMNIFRMRKYRKTLFGYIRTEKEEHAASFDESNIRDFVDLYIKNERSKLDESYDEYTFAIIILNLFVAGTETTATTLDWSLLYMISYPEIQRKCYEEICSVVGDGRMVKMSDRSNLVYVEATLMEVQRVANTLTTTLPHMASEDTTWKGYHIPKKTVILGLLSSAHYDTKYWKDPHQFRPERFIDDNGKLIKNDSFVPFSLGPRICLGESLAKMELFLIFSNLIQRYKFSKVDDSDVLSFKGVSGATTSATPYRLTAVLR